ncbi:hypothetical protein Taro_050669, partial [Colocasia esculenta]|nr:hypothetical protein [Colocasia esculenta]
MGPAAVWSAGVVLVGLHSFLGCSSGAAAGPFVRGYETESFSIKPVTREAHPYFFQMSLSDGAPHRDGKAPTSPVPPSPPAPQSPPSPLPFSPEFWNGFYTGWRMALAKASQLYGNKSLTNIRPEAEPICSSSPSSPLRSSSPPSPILSSSPVCSSSPPSSPK